MGSKQLEKSGSDAFVNVEKGAKGCVEYLDGTACTVASLERSITMNEELFGGITCGGFELTECLTQTLFLVLLSPWTSLMFEIRGKPVYKRGWRARCFFSVVRDDRIKISGQLDHMGSQPWCSIEDVPSDLAHTGSITALQRFGSELVNKLAREPRKRVWSDRLEFEARCGNTLHLQGRLGEIEQ